MQIKLAKTAGFCFGVNRAVDLVYSMLGEGIKYEELGLEDESATRTLREASDKIMGEIVDLWEEGHCK